MKKRRKGSSSGVMLELWRPPPGAGDPIGCLATTYTFAPGLFDEQCLARFLEIESEPNREGLAFLLERESRLGGVYAGVLVDHSQAGVEHSLRWDVLPVRIRGGKQHAKLSLLGWTSHIRMIVASANLTEPGYRTNHEVAAVVDLTPIDAHTTLAGEAIAFLRSLLLLVPSPGEPLQTVARARAFLDSVERRLDGWKPPRGRMAIRQHLVCTAPATGPDSSSRSALEEALRLCRARGGAPSDVRVASPFFDVEEKESRVVAALAKAMARGTRRRFRLGVPALRDGTASAPRLVAPRALLATAGRYVDRVQVEALPSQDADKNARIWHAKMMGFGSDRYTGVMVGSSNFTSAGLGMAGHRNAEANILTLVDHVDFSRAPSRLEAVWPEMEAINDPEWAEWLGPAIDHEEEEQAAARVLPAGFLSAVYQAGAQRHVVLSLEPAGLPTEWRIDAVGGETRGLIASAEWRQAGASPTVTVDWPPAQPPQKLLVAWDGQEAFLPLNVDDQRELPVPAHLERMSADDMLGILAASDPSAAFRVWARQLEPVSDGELDAAVPTDLDPLRKFDLHATFLHRVRRRARVLAQVRENLERPVAGRQALEWRLRGLIGIEALGQRLAREVVEANGNADEALLTLADFLIVLRDVRYEPEASSLGAKEFHAVYRPFLHELAETLASVMNDQRAVLSSEPMQFWERVVDRCRE